MLLLLTACTAPTPDPVPDVPADTAADPADTPEVPYTDDPTTEGIAGVVPVVVINEVQTDNDATIMTDDLAFADWIELYNPSEEAIALSRIALSDSGGNTWTGSEGVLEPGAHLLLWADVDLPFGLSVDGEHLELSVDGLTVDRLATGQMDADTAWARYPDGRDWSYTARPTPGWTNGSHPGDSTDPTAAFFQVDTITELQVWISDAQWSALEKDNYTEVEASLGVGPAWFDRVGFRKKSTVGSNRALSGKAAFKIDLNEYDDHSLGGLQSLTLNNMVQDPTYVAEHLAYSLYRAADIPAPRVGYVRLHINGEDRGLYALVESVDDNFLGRWFADDSGVLYEGAYGIDLVAGELDDFEVDQGETDLADLAAVAAVLAETPSDEGVEALEALVDLDRFLMNMAIEALILHWDGYTTANNYRLYNNPRTGRLVLLPWGTDQTFISSSYPPYSGYGVMMTYCMSNAGCRDRYSTALLDAADLMDSLSLQTEMDAVLDVLGEDIASDPYAEHTESTQSSYRTYMSNCIANCPDGIRGNVE